METAEMRRSTLQRKDRDQLLQIAETLGATPSSRARKGEIIELILELVSSSSLPAEPSVASPPPGSSAPGDRSDADDAPTPAPLRGDPPAALAESAGNAVENRDRPEVGNRRRRRRGRDRDNRENGDDNFDGETVRVEGHIDLRTEGYGFLRVAGYMASRDDAYVPVKLVRRHGLRKGDFVVGRSRPAGRSEKNPALLTIDSLNGGAPADGATRRDFDALTGVFPDEPLVMETPDDPADGDRSALVARIIDLVSPIGKGQRGLILSPPGAGKTTVVKRIARSLEANNPEVRLIVLLIDGRPEEVTEMRRRSDHGEVVAATFDKGADEQIIVAEMTVERAKRMAEQGADVLILLDSLTGLARAYKAEGSQPASSGSGIGPTIGPHAVRLAVRRLFGAARNLEEGGSLTIIATASVDTGSRTDEALLEGLTGAANMELRLDRLPVGADSRSCFPAIDIDGSHSRREDLLIDSVRLDRVYALRRLLHVAAEDGLPATRFKTLVEGLGSCSTNDEFLAEVMSSSDGS